MSDVETKSERGRSADLRVVSSAQSAARAIHRTRIRIVPVLITLATTALAVGFGWALWNAYMETPWTRDGTVRVYTVTMAPEVAGRIVELPVVDNQFVAKGGRPTRGRPLYGVLGESEIWQRITTHAVQIPLDAISSELLSFTYTDSWVTYVEREPNGDPIPRKPQYGQLYRRDELDAVFAEHGWPGERWKAEPGWENDLYVEAQIWSDEAVAAYLI